MQIEVIQCSTEVAMETLRKRQICTPNEKKMADSRFALSNQNIVENYTILVECLANIGD